MTYSASTHECSLIGGGPLVEIMDLGMHAYADTFIAEDQLHLSEPVFPLKVMLDPITGHIQLRYISPDRDRYTLYSYSYTSSNSSVSRQHWDELAQEILSKITLEDSILEIGSNDGYLSSQFLGKCRSVLGVDPSREMCDLAQSKGLPVINDLFTQITADAIRNTNGLQKIVISNNVLNHANDPVDFAQAVASVLTPDGTWVFEVPYWRDMVRNNWFDMIYHEHPSYFTVHSVRHLLKQAGLVIQDVEVINYHGSSLRITAGQGIECPQVPSLIDQEISEGLFDPNTYQAWYSRIARQRDVVLNEITRLRLLEPKVPIIGVGAAAKANTLMNFYRLDSSILHCVTDASDRKQGKYTPLSRIPIRGDNEFGLHDRCYALILSWNISEGLRQTLLSINPNVKFIQL